MVCKPVIQTGTMRANIRLMFPCFQNDRTMFADQIADKKQLMRVIDNILRKINTDLFFLFGRKILSSRNQIGFADPVLCDEPVIASGARQVN